MNRTLHIIIGVLLLLVTVGAVIMLYPKPHPIQPLPPPVIEALPVKPIATTTHQIIGSSVEGRDIESYTFGTGSTSVLFVGGVHGGYEWNSIALAYEMIDYLTHHEASVPESLTIHIIPNLNPDGLFAATGLIGSFTPSEVSDSDMHTSGTGRMNANEVDLNRNFACKWQPSSTWRNQVVSAGTEAFSEPEARALRDYVVNTHPHAAVFWHSQANNVYGAECEDGILPGTLTLMNTYAAAGGYGAVPIFDAYPVTGDAEGWLASIGIPAVTVELGSRTSTEWEKNLAGTMAVLKLYSR